MWNRSIIIHLHLIQMRFAGIMVDKILRIYKRQQYQKSNFVQYHKHKFTTRL